MPYQIDQLTLFLLGSEYTLILASNCPDLTYEFFFQKGISVHRRQLLRPPRAQLEFPIFSYAVLISTQCPFLNSNPMALKSR